jgi:RimJ/RimL family protein N-acetyltransferase
MRWAMELPELKGGGLGLRRLQWVARASNERSIRLAKRMGLREESVARYFVVLREDQSGNGGKPCGQCVGFPADMRTQRGERVIRHGGRSRGISGLEA